LSLLALAVGGVNAHAQSANAAEPLSLFGLAGRTQGKRLEPGSAQYVRDRLAGRKIEGRITPINPGTIADVRGLSVGRQLRLPVADGAAVIGAIKHSLREASGATRIAGTLAAGGKGSFSIILDGTRTTGMIEDHTAKVAFLIEENPAGGIQLREVELARCAATASRECRMRWAPPVRPDL
jgi:hypothetical protein